MKSKTDKKHELKTLIFPLLGKLNNVAMYLCRNRDEAEDLVAETLLKICENIDKLKDKKKFNSWAFRIMNNTFIDNYRISQNLNTVQFDEHDLVSKRNSKTLGVWGTNPEQFLINKLMDEDIRRNISLLPDEFRMTVILCDIENLAYREISEITGVPVGTVRSRLSRGRAILQKKLHHIALEMGIVKKKNKSKSEACNCN